jgi:phosphate butyryltransferase
VKWSFKQWLVLDSVPLMARKQFKNISEMNSFKDIFNKIKEKECVSLVCANPHSVAVLEALDDAESRGYIRPVYVGNPDKINSIAEGMNKSISADQILFAGTDEEAAKTSVSFVRQEKADLLMKGDLPTATLLKSVLDNQAGIRKENILSHIAVIEISTYSELMFITDGGINIHLDRNKRQAILKNSVEFAQSLGIERPKVAMLTLIEQVTSKIPETLDTNYISRNHGLNADVEGPISLDVAISSEAAEKKGIYSKIAGKSQIFIAPNITVANFLVKGLILLAGAVGGGIIVGAKVPIVLLSRSDDKETKLRSIALGLAVL